MVSTSTGSSLATAGNRTFVFGAASGLNTAQLIDAAYQQAVRGADRLEVRIDQNNTTINAYEELSGLTQSLRNSLTSLRASYGTQTTTTTSVFEQRTATIDSSDGTDPLSYIDITLNPNADTSSYDIEVINVAKAARVLSSGANGSFADKTSAANKGVGSFEIGLEGGAVATINFDNNSSLQSIVTQINNQTVTSGVKAEIVSLDGGASYQFFLTAQETGKAITYNDLGGDGFTALGITTSPGVYAQEIQAPEDATVTFEGITITQDSNTFSNVVDGFDFTAKNKTNGAILTVGVENDYSLVKGAIEGFVESFNSLRDFVRLNQQVGADGTIAEGADLFGDSILRDLSKDIQAVLKNNFTTDIGGLNLASLGITLDSNNRLEISDPSKLDAALINNPESVRQAFESHATIDNAQLRILSNKTTQLNYDFALDITVSGSVITGASVGGDNSLFDISGRNLVGKAGTAYEGLTLTYVGTASSTVNIQLNNGYANLTSVIADRYSNSVTGTLTKESLRLADANVGLEQDAAEIVARAETVREREIDRIAQLEAQIQTAKSVIAQIKAILNANNNDD